MPGGRPSNRTTILDPTKVVFPINNLQQLNIRLNQLNKVVTSSTEECIDWLAQYGMLGNSINCSFCNSAMKIHNCREVQDNIQWRCRDCNSRKSIKTN